MSSLGRDLAHASGQALRSDGSGGSLACPICERKDWRRVDRIRRAYLFRCEWCGLIATGDFLAGDVDLEEIYEVDSDHHQQYREWYLQQRLHLYKRFMAKMERFRSTGRLLEVGSSYGYFLGLASSLNWQAEGVELAVTPTQIAQGKGCKVTQGKLEDLPLGETLFDVIVMWDVIEHLTNVGEVLETAFALLRNGGALIARTPDARALSVVRGLFGAAYRHLAYPANTAEHVFHFTPESLSRLMSMKGFTQIETDTSGDWNEIIIGGRNALVRLGRSAIFRYAYAKNWPYEFVMTAVKPQSSL